LAGGGEWVIVGPDGTEGHGHLGACQRMRRLDRTPLVSSSGSVFHGAGNGARPPRRPETRHAAAGKRGVSDVARPAAASTATGQVEPDAQGRILIPQRLREYARLEREVAVIGALDRIEIWDAGRWHEISGEADESLLAAVTDLGI